MKDNERCQCGRWEFLPQDWDKVPTGRYFEIVDHMPLRLGGCTHLNGNIPPYKYHRLLHESNHRRLP